MSHAAADMILNKLFFGALAAGRTIRTGLIAVDIVSHVRTHFLH